MENLAQIIKKIKYGSSSILNQGVKCDGYENNHTTDLVVDLLVNELDYHLRSYTVIMVIYPRRIHNITIFDLRHALEFW